MKDLKILFSFVLLCVAATVVYAQSWDMFFDKGKEHYDKGNFEKAIENFELYLKYETTNPKAEAKQLLERAKKELAEEQTKQVAKTETTLPTEETPVIVAEQPSNTEQTHEEYFIETALGLNMKMIYVEGGTFMMGASSGDSDANDWEKPAHQVTLDSYYIAEFEVTQSQWEIVMGTTIYQQNEKSDYKGLYGVGDNYPMYHVNYEEAEEFCRKLSRLTGKNYVLPTEAQWEFAALGGNKGKNNNYKYSGSNSIDAVAWHEENSGDRHHRVGKKQANQLRIYDMSGNVWEWCSDWFSSYSSNNQSEARVARGGGYCYPAKYCRIACRVSQFPSIRGYDYGFRVVCIPE